MSRKPPHRRRPPIVHGARRVLILAFPLLGSLRERLIALRRRLCAPLRRLPGSSLSFGPPRRVHLGALPEDAPPGAEVVRLFPARAVRRAPPETSSRRVVESFSRCLETNAVPGYVMKLRNGRFVGDGWAGTIVDSNDAIVGELSPPWLCAGPARHHHLARLILPRAERVKSAVVLTAPDADHFYGHWVKDLLPRWELARRAGVDPSSGFCIVNHRDLPFQRETLEILGVDWKRVIRAGKKTHILAEELIVPSFVFPPNALRDYGYPEEAISFLRERLSGGPPAQPGRRLIYISRRQAVRPIANESEIVPALEKLGFEVHLTESYSVRGQIELFRQAAVVLGPHGAGLNNMIFCPSGTLILEIFAPNYIKPNFWGLAQQLGHRYSCYCEEDGAGGSRFDRAWGWHSPSLDPEALTRWVKDALVNL